jgi:siroheme synthase (precorrin-2 oxidase/ferrochelatase)
MNDHTHVMTDEEWAENKSCEIKKRDHRWRWLIDIATGQPHATEVICSHCGKRASMTRDKLEVHE